ncbi:MAG: acetyl-CoA carboxylase biotin carboxyl carrier protein [Gemmatimonadaceae bacterium]|nr:acetyl-CoA carboxylase biotin carboxyl carrier protein [Acetobacteraceae bacterium]
MSVIMRDAGLTEIKIVTGDARLHLVRAAPVLVQAAPAVVQAALPAAVAPPEDPGHPNAVTSPMVGIAYLAPEPGATPFIAVGQVVTAGQTVLLIEAMKTFNQIKAPHAGTVTRILVASGEPVEFAQPLLVIE